MPLDLYNAVLVDHDTVIKKFVCDDEDLTSFLLEKSINFSKELLAVTYIFESESDTVAYFSIFNDTLKVEQSIFASKSAFKKFLADHFGFGKRHLRVFPAIKLGRLAVCDKLRSKGIGRKIIEIIIGIAVEQNKICACKFITVDAYDQSLSFYEKLGFSYLSNNDIGDDTRQMYIDLTQIVNAEQKFVDN